jgi:hypothetical protein
MTLAVIAAIGCAPGGDDSAAPPDGRDDAQSDDATARDDGMPDGSEDSSGDGVADETSDVGPGDVAEVPPEVPSDVVETVEADIPWPDGCPRTGDRDCSARSGPASVDVDRPPIFRAEVDAAIDAVILANPAWFVTEGYPACCPLIQPGQEEPYMTAVTNWLYDHGLCASGPGEELGVKHDNECSESYDIIANPADPPGTSLVRRAFYTATSLPSYF